MNDWVIGGIIAASLIGSFLYKNWVTNRTLRKLYLLRNVQQKDEFLKEIEGFNSKFYFSEFTRKMMALNFLMEIGCYDEATAYYQEWTKLKMKADEKIAFGFKLYELTILTKDKDRATKLKHQLLEAIEKSKNKNHEALKGEIKLLYAVYFEKDVSLIGHIELELQNINDRELKAEYYHRLAKLYYADENQKKSLEALENAIQETQSEARKKSLLNTKENLHLLA